MDLQIPFSADGYVDVGRGLIDRAIFSDQRVFELERERVFHPSWHFVGHESQLGKPGDFFLSYAGHEAVIVNRDSTGKVRVMLNWCRHRGMRVCRYDRGNADRFTCPYHFWSYSNDGRLTGIPKKKSYEDSWKADDWGLSQARVTLFHGSIWATFSKDAPSFEDFLGDAAFMLRDFWQSPDGSDDGYEVVEGIQKWTMPANWKFGAENVAGDLYHDPSHASVQRLGIGLTGLKGRHAWDADTSTYKQLNLAYPAGGHAGRISLYDDAKRPYVSMWKLNPEVDEYYREAHYTRQKRLGDKARFYNRGGIIFPSMAYNAAGRTSVSIWIPRSPGLTEVWRWYFVPRNASPGVKDAIRHYLLRYGGPAGMVEQDDIENWSGATRGSESTLGLSIPFSYQLHMGQARWAWPEPWLGQGALVDEGVSEHSQRTFYARWNALMTNS